VLAVVAACGGSPATQPAATTEPPVVNVYNWPDCIDRDVLARFSNETGIAVNYDTLDPN
jgi:spermidine/putrescine-binding protein